MGFCGTWMCNPRITYLKDYRGYSIKKEETLQNSGEIFISYYIHGDRDGKDPYFSKSARDYKEARQIINNRVKELQNK